MQFVFRSFDDFFPPPPSSSRFSLFFTFLHSILWLTMCLRVHESVGRSVRMRSLPFRAIIITWHFYGKKNHIAHAHTCTGHVNAENILITKTKDRKSIETNRIVLFPSRSTAYGNKKSRILSYIVRTFMSIIMNLNQVHTTFVEINE